MCTKPLFLRRAPPSTQQQQQQPAAKGSKGAGKWGGSWYPLGGNSAAINGSEGDDDEAEELPPSSQDIVDAMGGSAANPSSGRAAVAGDAGAARAAAGGAAARGAAHGRGAPSSKPGPQFVVEVRPRDTTDSETGSEAGEGDVEMREDGGAWGQEGQPRDEGVQGEEGAREEYVSAQEGGEEEEEEEGEFVDVEPTEELDVGGGGEAEGGEEVLGGLLGQGRSVRDENKAHNDTRCSIEAFRTLYASEWPTLRQQSLGTVSTALT